MKPTAAKDKSPADASQAYFRIGAAVIVTAVLAVLALLVYYVGSLQTPSTPSSGGKQNFGMSTEEDAAALNNAADIAGFGEVEFISRHYPNGAVNEVNANLGESTNMAVASAFRYLHNVVEDQALNVGVVWNGGLRAHVGDMDIYLDADLSPDLVDSLAKVDSPYYSRVTLTTGSTTAITRGCEALQEDPRAFDNCASGVASSVGRLIEQFPADHQQHTEVYLMMGDNGGQNSAGLIHLKQRPNSEDGPDVVADRASSLISLYYALIRLPNVKAVYLDSIQPLTPAPAVRLHFADGCDTVANTNALSDAQSRITAVNARLGLNLVLEQTCE